MARWRYAQWDGTQGAEWEADDLLRKLGDDLLYHGDVHAALRRLMREGFTGPGHERVAGLRELLERLRGQRSRRLARQGLGQPLAPMARELREIVALERSEIAGRPDAAERGLHLDLLPPDPVGQIESLHGYDFASGEAARRFDELVERLRSELLRAQFHRMAGALPATTPQDRRRLAEMLEALNELVAMREAGLPTDAAFAQFMDAYGGFFPDRPATLDQLLERLAQQMAAFEAAVAAMSPEQRAALRELAEALLAEAGLAAQVARLGQYLQAAYPGAGWGPGYGLRGRGGLGLAGAAELMGELGALDRLEALLEGAPSPGALGDVDLEEVARLLGHDAADAMARLSRVARDLEAAGVVEARAGR
ncbi:MAG: hypothetical protein ACRD0M_11685, partial [Acidimicrobiales bacterium]